VPDGATAAAERVSLLARKLESVLYTGVADPALESLLDEVTKETNAAFDPLTPWIQRALDSPDVPAKLKPAIAKLKAVALPKG
jgi:hypothetical protein